MFLTYSESSQPLRLIVLIFPRKTSQSSDTVAAEFLLVGPYLSGVINIDWSVGY